MNAEPIVTSGALYFAPEQYSAVPLDWFERARRFLVEHHLCPILFTAYGGGFLLDDCYVLADHGGDLAMFGETIKARGSELVRALQDGRIEGLGLDSPRPGAEYREDWRADVSVFLGRGECYVGIDERLAPDVSSLLRHTYEIAEGLFDIRYGIAYKLPLAQYPDGYASGFVKTSFCEVLEMIRHRREWESREKSPDELWSDELSGQRRHLSGLFRAAYPASVLSEAHIQAANLRSCGIGKLSPLDSSLWLWELSESELPVAQSLLVERDVLVSGGCAGPATFDNREEG